MTDPKSSDKATMQRAMAAVREARAALEAVKKAKREPLAIVGMGCRFPGGADSPAAYWRLLAEGRDGIGPVPADRWQADAFYDEANGPEKMRFREAGFVPDPDHFDPGFFGIAPIEAKSLDPQQRLLLKTAWEAFEDAGYTADALRGSETGVFVGANNYDYFSLRLEDPASLDTYAVVGSAASIIANRLSYTFDLRGPSMVLDTACSSSLTALHLAAQSLRAGEVDLAVAAGVNVLLAPYVTMAHSKGFPMAPDARCHTFDADAKGYVRGEGCGAVILKRLSDALQDGDLIWAVVRGSAVNQDGRTNGLMAPNGQSQMAVIRKALTNANIEPATVSYLEAHGTATELGDPIEVESLRAVYGQPAGSGALVSLGSVKSNVGHLEAAAGIAGVIKTALSLHHRTIPATLHFQRLNPLIDLADSNMIVAQETSPWPVATAGTPRRAAVSAFGAGGSNGHVILEEAPPTETGEPKTELSDASQLLVLSARSAKSLQGLAHAWADALSEPSLPLRDACYTAMVHRQHHPLRLAVHGNRNELVDQLRAWQSSPMPPTASETDAGITFVFPGQGGQWTGMAEALLREEPVFAEAIDACDAAARPFLDWSIRRRLEDAAESGSIDVDQPCLWAMCIGLAALWRSRGLEPAQVMGISMGEVAAAHVAGAISLADSARIICRRSALLKQLEGKGGMALIGLGRDATEAAIEAVGGALYPAVVYGPATTAVAGDPEALNALVSHVTGAGSFAKAIQVTIPSHCRLVDPILEELAADLVDVQSQLPEIPLFSTVTGHRIEDEALDADYWCRNLRQPIDLHQQLPRVDQTGAYLELGPHPVLATGIEQTLETLGWSACVAVVMKRDESPRTSQLRLAGELYQHGLIPVWPIEKGQGRRQRVPVYVWDEQAYWFVDGAARERLRYPRSAQAAASIAVDDLYQMRWVEQPPPEPLGLVDNPWLVINGDDRHDESLVAALTCSVGQVSELRLPPKESAQEQCARLNDALGADPTRWDGIVFAAFGDSTDEHGYRVREETLLGLMQRLQAVKMVGRGVRLWILTRGGEAADGLALDPRQARAWGLGRSFALECPQRWGGLIDLDPAGVVDWNLVAAVLRGAEDEDQWLQRGARCLTARLSRPTYLPVPDDDAEARRCHLVIGPALNVTRTLVEDLASHGNNRVGWLVTDGDAGAGLPDNVDVIDQPNAFVKRVVADGYQPDRLVVTNGPWHTIPIDHMTAADLATADRTVLAGLASLEAEIREQFRHELLLSSPASDWGSAGLAHLAAAQRQLESTAAAHLRSRAVTILRTIPWQGGGMVATEDETRSRDWGIQVLDPKRARTVVDQLMRRSQPGLHVYTMADVQWSVLKSAYQSVRPRPFLEDVGDDAASTTDDVKIERLRQMSDMPVQRRRRELLTLLTECAAEVLGFEDTARIDVNNGLFQMGLDSMMAIKLRARLEAATGQRVPAAMLFQHPTLAALTDAFETKLFSNHDTQSAAEDQPDAATVVETAERSEEAELMAALEQAIDGSDA